MSGDNTDQGSPCDPRSWPEESGPIQGACNHNPTIPHVAHSAAGRLSPPPRRKPGQTSSREAQDTKKTNESHQPQVLSFEENLTGSDSYELPSTVSPISTPISTPVRSSLLDAGSPITFSCSSHNNNRPSTSPHPLPSTTTQSQSAFDISATCVEGLTAQSPLGFPHYLSLRLFNCTSGTSSNLNDSPSLLREGSHYPQSSSTHPGADAQCYPEDLAELWGSSEQDQEALLQQPPLFNGLPAQIEHMRGLGCKCTRSHAYRTCPRFSEHFWIWLAEGAGKNDFCTCPPTDESLLMLECPKLMQHIQDEFNRNLPLSGITEVTSQCSCPMVWRYISARCSLYRQHLDRARKGKARSYPENPLSCSCAKNPDLVSRSCLLCVNEILLLEMNKMYEPGRQRRHWNLESLIATASEMFGSNGANLGNSVTSDRSSLQNLDTGILETNDEALTRRHPDGLSPSSHQPNHGLHQVMDFQSGHGGMNGKFKEPLVPSSIGDNPRRVVTHRIDELLHRAGDDGGRVISSIDARKRRASEGSLPSRKKRKIDPPSNVSPVHELSPSLPPARLSEEFEPSRGGKKCNVKLLSAMRKEDYYYLQKTSLGDQTYFHNVIKKLHAAVYLWDPQRLEPTISSEAGVTLVGEPRVDGPGRAKKGESVFAILVDKPPSGPFLCWICGHLEKQRKNLRALGHVREHFGHKPWTCTEDHRTILDGTGIPKMRRVREKDGPCGQRFTYREALDDHQEKRDNFYPCRSGNCNKTFSTPSNRCKHEKKHL